MKIFVASSFLNKLKARKLEDGLRYEGYAVVSAWVNHPKGMGMRDAAIDDVQRLVKADALVVLWPGRLGTNAELGMAIALGIPVVMVGAVPTRKSVYFHHPLVTIVANYAELLEKLIGLLEDAGR